MDNWSFFTKGQFPIINDKRISETVQQIFRNRLSLGIVLNPGQQDDKFITTQTAYGITGAHRVLEAAGSLDQQLVTGFMPKRITPSAATGAMIST